MFLRHRAEGATEDTLYEFRPERTLGSRARIVEKLYTKLCGERRTWEQFVADAKSGSIAARQIALWLAQTEVHPTLRFEDMPDYRVGELGMEYSKQELRQAKAAIEANRDLVESEKAAMLAGIDAEIDDAPAGSDEPDVVEDDPGKGDSNDEPSTS